MRVRLRFIKAARMTRPWTTACPSRGVEAIRRLVRGARAPRFPMFPSQEAHAPLSLFPADHEGDAQRGGDRLAPAHAALRDDPAGGGRHLRLAPLGRARPAQDLPN